MRPAIGFLALSLIGAATSALSADGTEVRLNRYFKLWETDGGVTRANVQEMYTGVTNYYGRPLNTEQVLQAKRFLARQWPNRKYSVIPGTIQKSCAGDTCRVDLVLSWKVADAGGQRGTTGATTVALVFVREAGELKIASENGTPVSRSFCRNEGGGWSCLHQAFGRTSSR